MRIASFERPGGGVGYGVVEGTGLVDLSARLRDTALLEVVAAPERAREAAAGAPADFALDDVVLLPPLPRPPRILCVGVNYLDRNAEYRDDSEAPRYPSLFMRSPASFVGHGSALWRPPESAQLDYEGEIAMVIGRGGRRIPRERARDHIAGLTCCNEGGVRDWMRHGKFNVTQGKNFDRSGAMGPWLVTADELDPLGTLTVETRVNGSRRQRDSTDHLGFPFDFLLHYISTFTTLECGDVVSTGTPRGAGIHQDPPVFLVPGDVVEVEVSGVGTLRNTVADEGG